MNDLADAEDVLQDALAKILGGEVNLPDEREYAWRCLLATIRNVARNHGRRDGVRRTEPLDQVPPSYDRSWEVWEWGWKLCERMESKEALEEALEALTPAQREVIVLRYDEGWKVREVAEHRGSKQRAVKMLAAKALASLAAEIDGEFGAE